MSENKTLKLVSQIKLAKQHKFQCQDYTSYIMQKMKPINSSRATRYCLSNNKRTLRIVISGTLYTIIKTWDVEAQPNGLTLKHKLKSKLKFYVPHFFNRMTPTFHLKLFDHKYYLIIFIICFIYDTDLNILSSFCL